MIGAARFVFEVGTKMFLGLASSDNVGASSSYNYGGGREAGEAMSRG